jgi:hypothetical protein
MGRHGGNFNVYSWKLFVYSAGKLMEMGMYYTDGELEWGFGESESAIDNRPRKHNLL